MKKSIKSIVVLVCICGVVASLLAVTNYFTAPIIEKNEQKQAYAALLEVLPEGGSFELVDISQYKLPATVSAVYKAENGGYVVKLNTTGYAAGMVLMCGISSDGKVVATKLIASAETPSIGGTAAEKFAPSVVGKDKDNIDGVDTIAGATKTTAAYRSAVKDALNTVYIIGGGSVDIRTEEEILNENLSAALPSANGEFEKHLFVEVVEGIDAIYTAKNNSGAVCVIGEQFIGIDKDGNVLTKCSESDAQAVKDAMAKINATTTTDIDLGAYEGISKQIISVKLTDSGNYIIEVKANGYSAQNSYAPPEMRIPIIIRVSMTADGVIIDCITVSHAESTGYGDACANEKFYGQFDGKTEDTYNDIDAISGATVTTNAYKAAISVAFKTVKILQEVTE